jgi:site-specific recombinase XerD
LGNLKILKADNLPGNVSIRERNKLYYGFLNNYTSKNTRTAYAKDLSHFLNWLFGNFKGKSEFDVDHDHLVAYKEHLIGKMGERTKKSFSRRSINRALACLGAFYEHLFIKGLVKENPTRRLRRFKVSKEVVTVDLSDEQVRRLFEVIDISTSAGTLHRAVLSVLFSTGMRHGELVNLKFENLVQENEFVVFKYFGKGDKEMVTPLNERVLSHLGEYLEWCKAKGYSFSKSDFLFRPTKNPKDGELNKRLSSKAVGYMMRKYCKIIGVEGKVTVHSARSTVIGLLLSKGHSIDKVADYVGHQDISTTKAYNKRKSGLNESLAFAVGDWN